MLLSHLITTSFGPYWPSSGEYNGHFYSKYRRESSRCYNGSVVHKFCLHKFYDRKGSIAKKKKIKKTMAVNLKSFGAEMTLTGGKPPIVKLL
jgi:hypothetical protein